MTATVQQSPAAPPPAPDWRGVSAERAETVSASLTVLLRTRTRRLLGSLLRPHRRAMLGLLVVVLAENAAAMAGPYLVKVGIDHGIPAIRHGSDYTPIALAAAGLVVATVAQAVLRQVFLMVSGRVGQQLLLDVRERVFAHFQRLSLSFHERYTAGRMISRLTSDMDAISDLLDTGLDGLLTAVLSILSIAAIMLWLDLPLAAVSLLVFPLLLWLTAWFRRESAIAYRATREAVALVIVHFVETLGGIRAVQAFRREPRNQQIFDELNDRYRLANDRGFRLNAWFGPGIKLLGNTTIAVVLLYGGYRAFHGQMTVGVLAAFLLYLRRFFEPMQELSQFYNSFQAATAALEKLSGVLDEQPAVAEPTAPVALPPQVSGEIVFAGVRFGYRDAVVLPRVDLVIPAGQTVALVGETGAGKSTLARLLARFYDPEAGRITFDGVDLRDLDEASLRRAVVMVTQESFLFTGTVADNIRFGRPAASTAQVEAAARAIGADRFIEALPRGYDTDVGKRGGRLSAGQRQLVAFARAFLADPAVLILDEATSSLDVPTERAVQRALRTVLADRTALVIAHRLTTVEIADRVLVMADGEIVEDGTPTELTALASGRYGELQRAWRDSLV